MGAELSPENRALVERIDAQAPKWCDPKNYDADPWCLSDERLERLLNAAREEGRSPLPKDSLGRGEVAEAWRQVKALDDQVTGPGDGVPLHRIRAARDRLDKAIAALDQPADPAPPTRRDHELKTWPEFFAAVRDGRKTFELRQDDRDYHEGDTLTLREWEPGRADYTGAVERRRITYVLRGPLFGLPAGRVILALASPAPPTREAGEDEWLPDPGNDDDLLRRGDITAMLVRLADGEAERALYGEPDNASNREASEAAYTRARCAIALMPSAAPPTREELVEALRPSRENVREEIATLIRMYVRLIWTGHDHATIDYRSTMLAADVILTRLATLSLLLPEEGKPNG